MSHPYGMIIVNHPQQVKRLVMLANDHALLQTLRVEEQVEVTLSELGAIIGALESLEQGDPVLRKLQAEQEASA